jgi:predicted nuclease of predicted toxin-antitoxin system
MKLLLDANLSWRLVEKLKPYFDDCVHVDKCNLPVPAKDLEV